MWFHASEANCSSFPVIHKVGNVGTFAQFLPPATKLEQGYIFTGVCDSVHGGGGCLVPGSVPGPRGAWSRGGCLVPGGPGRDPQDGYCYGQYASYWNAILLMRINLKCLPMKSILLHMYIIMMLWIKIEITGNNIHEIFKVKAINKMPTLCIMGKVDLQPGCSANLRTLEVLGFLMLKNTLPQILETLLLFFLTLTEHKKLIKNSTLYFDQFGMFLCYYTLCKFGHDMFATHSGVTPLFSMRTKSQASSQSCRSVDADSWCKRTLRMKQ